MKTSPTQRSKTWLQDRGWQVAIVEHWNPHCMIRQDLWGFGDLLACRPIGVPLPIFGGTVTAERDITIIQTTSGANVAARKAKILAEPRARVWLQSGGEIVVHGWRKVGPRGKRKLWELREVPIFLSDFPLTPPDGEA